MSEPEGRSDELERQMRIDVRIVAAVMRERVGAEQVRQKFRVGDVGDLGGHDGAGLIVELVAAPVRMLIVQLVDLVVVLAQEQRVQRGERGIFRGARVARDEHAAGNGR